MTRVITTLFSLYFLCLSAFVTAAETEGPLKPHLGKPSMEMQQVFKGERFGNIVVTTKGTVLATWGTSHVRACRSEDGGKSWGKEIIIAKPGFQCGGLTVDETTGNIWAFVEERHPPAPLHVYRSQDDGKSWQEVSIKLHPDSKGNMPSMHMNEHGIRGVLTAGLEQIERPHRVDVVIIKRTLRGEIVTGLRRRMNDNVHGVTRKKSVHRFPIADIQRVVCEAAAG